MHSDLRLTVGMPYVEQHCHHNALELGEEQSCGKPTRSLKDEREFHERDPAARWLERREKWEQTAAKIKQEKHAARAKRAKRSKPNERKSHSDKAAS